MLPQKGVIDQETQIEDETVLLPNHAVLKNQGLSWTQIYELTRLFHGLSPEEQERVDLQQWAQLTSKIDNPADMYDSILKDKRLDRFERITSRIKTIFEQTSKEDLPALERRIGYSLSLDSPRKDKSITIRLNAPNLCKPNELNRTYGADKFLFIKLTDHLCLRLRTRYAKKTTIQKAFDEFIHMPIRIGHKLFFFILRKENMLWFVSTETSDWLSLKKFINGLLDLKLNRGMTVAKWVARTTLVLSSTQSSIDIDPQDIRRIPDIYSDSLIISRELLSSVAETLGLNYLPSCIQGRIRNKAFVWRLGVPHQDNKYLIQLWDDQIGKASHHIVIKFQVKKWDLSTREFVSHEEPTVVQVQNCLAMGNRGRSEIMTDGAGIISREAAARICDKLGRRYDVLPAAYQARIAFAKGLWLLSPNKNPSDVTPWIEVRDSQWKAEPADNFHFHFNLCRISRSPSNSNLGKQLLPILTSRGVTTETICKALEEYIRCTISDLNTKDPVRLAAVLTRGVSLTHERRSILARILNLEHDPYKTRSFNEFGLNLNADPEYYESWEMTVDKLDKMSLNPSSLDEQVVSMLAAGFEPSNRYIVDKIRRIKEERILNAIKFKIPIAQSAFVYVVPDPTGTLKENEVFLQFSDFRDLYTEIKISTLIGQAVVSRSPCVAPIDARKVQMVDNEILSETYFDVLVCSIQGNMSLLSLLSGGDYDGDQVTVIWDSTLVNEFENVDVHKYPRINVEEYFQSVQAGTINKSLLGLYENNAKNFVKRAQSIQIAGLFTPNDTGSYSSKHTSAEYFLGSDHPLTQKLGEVYVKCLDAPKAGLVLKLEKDNLLKSEYETTLEKVRNEKGKKVVSFNEKFTPLPKFMAENSKFTMGGPTKTIQYSRGGKVHILDALLSSGYALLRKYKGEIDVKDCLTHNQRFFDRDHDLCSFFIEQKKIYEFDKMIEGSQDIWIGVLRPLQRNLADLLIEFGKTINIVQNLKTRDKIWESEYGPGTAAGSKYAKASFPIQKIYHAMSYEKAFDFEPDLEDIQRHKIDLVKFKSHIKMYLEGLGPMGYALLKASCLAMCSNPEAFAPYELAFRETCYLKAIASQTKKPSNLMVQHFSSSATMECMSHRPPRSIITESYLTSIVKIGVVQGRSTAKDQLIPV